MYDRKLTILSFIPLILISGCALFPQNSHQYYNPLDGYDDPADVYVGQDMTEVRSTWGYPSKVMQTRSNGEFQKWIYPTGLSQYGDSSARVVYFERGRVVGWETLE